MSRIRLLQPVRVWPATCALFLLSGLTWSVSGAQEGPPPPPPARADEGSEQPSGPALYPATGVQNEALRNSPGTEERAIDLEVPELPLATAPTGAWLGVDLVERFRNQAMVLRVHRGSPAERAGIRADDVILSVAGKQITSRDHLIQVIGQMQPGSDVEVQVERDRRLRVMDAVLGRRNDVVQGVEEIGPGITIRGQSPEVREERPPPRRGAACCGGCLDDARAARVRHRAKEDAPTTVPARRGPCRSRPSAP